MAHLKQGSVTVRVGDIVRRGQPLAAVGNNGHSNEPHLHLQVQDSPAGADADRTYPMVFRNVHITRGGAWPVGRQPRSSHRRPRPSTRAVSIEPGRAAWPTAGGQPAVGGGFSVAPPGGVRWLLG